jgi:hypothetical protein
MDRPTQVNGIAVDMHVESGMILPAARMRLPASYMVDSLAPIRTLEGIPSTSAVAPVSTGSDRQLPADLGPDLTGVVRYLAAVTGQRPAPTVPFLQAVVVALQKTARRIDMTSTPNGKAATYQGTSLSEVINAVTVRQQATPEQFATLFAVVARSLGVPARLATGFRVGAAASGPVSGGPHVITDRQAWTWAEIPVAGVGWVVADPTPQQTASSQDPPLSGVQPPSTTVPPPQANAVPGNAPGAHALAPQAQLKLPRHGHRSVLWAIGLGALLVLAAVVGAAILVFGIAAICGALVLWPAMRQPVVRLPRRPAINSGPRWFVPSVRSAVSPTRRCAQVMWPSTPRPPRSPGGWSGRSPGRCGLSCRAKSAPGPP